MQKAKLLGNVEKGLVFVVSAPAGTGKTTLVEMLLAEFSCVVKSISYTTRQPRSNEIGGVHYNFVEKQEFKDKIAFGDFLEYVKLYGQYYGTSRQWVEEQQRQGKHVVLVIDTQGALQLMPILKATYVFIMPPSIDELRNRLVKRQTETPKVIEERLAWARSEIEYSRHYDYCIVNDLLQNAYEVLRSIFIAEEHRIKR